ncbi:UbiX family flavin prenyltransferase [Metallosphaera tengchongensis]|uniref:Flavin prenyltransferase UbiX n=1 Tax=Metallosphaera tengchongensis TaxID=1532350 RepID=A0A6N0NSS0_9CREN|nr:UbiX family flavin prenyltransferase [Metallosphaera tengchongensis]QKQ99785.1 UbiX family flavin prenyltransferase [Metallosphaera tengchongensis]
MDEGLAKEARANQGKGKIIIGITGASGTIYGLYSVQILRSLGYTPIVIISKGAERVARAEQGLDLFEELRKLSSEVYLENEIDAPPSSSSSITKTAGMAIIPCSIKTLAQIAHGISSNLISRTAINMLRVRKRLVLVIRETPLGTIELKNALEVSKAGGIILPASPGFYIKPRSIEDVVKFVVGKTLDVLEIEHDIYKRWTR